MATIVTRESGATAKGSPLTNAELDANFINLNAAKLELGNIKQGYGVALDVVNNDITIRVDSFSGLCKNVSGATIVKGTPVYQVGVDGNTPTVAPADASNPAKMPAIGVVGADIANTLEGEIKYLGFINGVNTASFATGDEVYVAAGGGYTNIKPTNASGTLIQFLGIVDKVHATNGSGIIFGTATYTTQSVEKTDDVLFDSLNVIDKVATQTNLEVDSSTRVTAKAVAMAIALG